MSEAQVKRQLSNHGLSATDEMLLQREVEKFLYHEARLLDDRQYQAWYELLADDIHYWMPIRRTVTSRDLEQEFTKKGEMAYFDEDKELLAIRVNRFDCGYAWAEDPPSRTRHMVTNVIIDKVDGDEIHIDVSFHLYRTRLETEVDTWVGRRKDVLRRTEEGLKICLREIYLDQTLIRATNMSTLF